MNKKLAVEEDIAINAIASTVTMAFIISNTSDNTQVLVFSYHEFGGRRRWSGSLCRLKC